MWHLLKFEILNALAVVLLQGPSSNQTAKPRKTVKREAAGYKKNNYTERTQKGRMT
jgi:hypothetical protein